MTTFLGYSHPLRKYELSSRPKRSEVEGSAVKGALCLRARSNPNSFHQKCFKPHSLRKDRFLNIFCLRPHGFVALEKTNAGAPAQNRFVVACRSYTLRFLE